MEAGAGACRSAARILGADQARTDAATRLLPSPEGNPALGRLVDLAARLLSATSAQISLLTTEQTVVAGAGLGGDALDSGGPLGETLCTITAAARWPLVVTDALVDERFAQLPPVTSGALRAYLGVPLLTPAGQAVGALCVFAASPRSWSEHDVGLLAELASSVMAELELSPLAAEERTAGERAEAAVARLELLVQVSTELAATLQTEAAVARLAKLVVPALGDASIVTLVEDGGLRDIGWWHADVELRPALERYAATRVEALTADSLLGRALRTSRPVLVAENACELIAEVLLPGEARDALRTLHPESAAFLPLRARGRTVGLLSLFRGRDRPGLSDADVAIAAEVAARAGLAVDNALLYAEQRSLAEGLQRSLLTDPPEPDHCHIVVRYVPAAQSASVGGDWFDSFLQADGATVLVIGDVVGHDTEAAAAMGQVRSLLRGIAWYSGAGPAEVLSGLDAAMEGLAVGTIATAVIARLEQTEVEQDLQVRRLRWSNAGHPPPMTIAADGTVTVLDGPPADLLLGIDACTERAESTVILDNGATVLLYTDGLVERRSQGLDVGIAMLRDTLGDLAALPLDELCDELLARMLPEGAEDDVALVGLRLHPQDRPRPAEAGPER
ncbi:MAG: SpoIIE family protein phosphatase [Actinomycetota bacterium]|nr:SpoIIE family protein phosphatase [Actinomycetota bacterium]